MIGKSFPNFRKLKFLVFKNIRNFWSKVDYQLVPPHEFVEESSIDRLRKKYFVGFLKTRKLGNLIPIFWYSATLIFSPISLLIYLCISPIFPLKIVKIDLSQIGSLLWLASIAAQKKNKFCDFNFVVCLPRIFQFQNQHIFDYLSEETFQKFVFVKDFCLRFFYSSLSWFEFCSIDTKKYEFFKENHFSEFSKEISNSISFNIEKKLEDIELDKARLNFKSQIKKNGLVTLNLRNSSFYKEERKSLRNVSGVDYFDVCVYLNERDYSIAFTHSPGSELLAKLDALSITYRIFDSRDKVGQFENLLSLISCKYFIGSSTGASVIPLMRNIPVLFTNSHIPFWVPLKSNDVVIWKKYFLSSGDLISFEEFVNLGLDIPSRFSYLFKKKEIKLVSNSSEELLTALKLFLELQDPYYNRKQILKKYLATTLKDYTFFQNYRWTFNSEAVFLKSNIKKDL